MKTTIGAALDDELKNKLNEIADKNYKKRIEHLFFFIKERILRNNRGFASFGDKSFLTEDIHQLSKFFSIERTGKNMLCFKLIKIGS